MSFFITHEDKQVVPLWIGGKDQPVRSSQVFEVIKASENRTVHHVHSADETDAKAAIEAATTAFASWSKTPLAKRREILNKASELLRLRTMDIDALQQLETSSPPNYSCGMSAGAADTMLEIASQITNACTGDLPHSENDNAVTVMRMPIGPVLFISPWNSPTFLGPRGIATALAAGCTVILKASELCPYTYRVICQIFADAGLPAGALNQIVVRREDAVTITETIIADPRIRKVEFIGSAAVGSSIAQLCGKHLKPILLELGGKCPAIICKDANLAAAAQACAFGACWHHGQICMSTERVIVVKEVAEEFSALLKAAMDSWVPMAGGAASKQLGDKAHALVQEAVEAGAEFLTGDNSFLDEAQTKLRPTVVTKVPKDSRLYYQECFGPSTSLYVVDDDEQALELANDSPYGLTGCIWTANHLRGLNLAKRLEVSLVSVNGGTVVVDIPHTMSVSASKGSGWGSINGAAGIREFLFMKAVVVRPHEQ